MRNFQGFEKDVFFMLAQNKFNDSKTYYDSIKDELKQKAIVPMRLLASDLSEQLMKIDDKMNVNPTRMVSRIRRDTRFSKNKTLYRDNVWCMFMRAKNQWRYQSCLWFEYSPMEYNLGVGFFNNEPIVMQYFRKALLDETIANKFKKAIKSAEKVGAYCSMTQYKKPKPDSDKVEECLRQFYNAKEFYFMFASKDLGDLLDENFTEIVSGIIEAFTPMYQLLQEITDKIIADQFEKEERECLEF